MYVRYADSSYLLNATLYRQIKSTFNGNLLTIALR